MSTIEKYRTELIAKLYLQSLDFIKVQEGDNRFDFIVSSNQNPNNWIGVEIKSSNSPKDDLAKWQKTLRNRNYSSPFLLMVINEKKETGYFTLVTDGSSPHKAKPLNVDSLSLELNSIFFNK